MHKLRTLAAKLGAIGAAMLLLALAATGLTLWLSWQLEGGAAAVNEAGRLRMQAWRLAQTLDRDDRPAFAAQLHEVDASLTLLRRGDPSRPLALPGDAATRAAFADVQQRWQDLRDGWAGERAHDGNITAAQTAAFVSRVDGFVGTIEKQLSRWTTLLNSFQLAMMGLVMASAVALLYATHLFVLSPLARLREGLARASRGDLAARVPVDTPDEFGALAVGFNDMAQTLQGLYGSLETRVQEKTLGLETERARLAALYEAAAFVASASDLDALAQGFARQLRRVAGADASAVRWSDEGNRRYVMLASDCLPQDMLEAERCIPTGGCFCGQAQERAYTRVIPIRAGDAPAGVGEGGAATLFGHCERAGFDTVVGVPVRLHERMVGEINLFYRRATALSDDDRALLEALASHLAGAIESLRAGALDREAAVAEERGLLARELHDSIAQSLAFLKIQATLLRGHLQRRDAAGVERTVDELDAGIRESLADVRELLLHFRTRTNGEDIEPALRTTLTKFEHQTGLRTHLQVEGEGLPLPPDVQVQVLHVVQEALSNVRKHAGARQVWVEVQQAPFWRFEVRDDGSGFGAATPDNDETHVGLRIMRERAGRVGASVEVDSVPGAGTSVVLTLPLPLPLPLAQTETASA